MRIDRLACSLMVVAVFLVLPASAAAQQIGVKAGVNFAYLTPEEDEDPDDSWRPGPIGGVWIRAWQRDRLSFQAEGLFSEKGVKFRFPFIGPQGETGDADVRIRYFEIPLLARFDFGEPATTRVFVAGGLAPAFKLGARSTLEVAGETHTRDADEDFYSWDLGLVGGVGVEFGRALIEARYTHGIRHINTDDNGDEDRIKNRVVSIMAGFRFR